MKCASCGNDVSGGKKFCNKCGSPMPQQSATAGGEKPSAGFRPPGWENAPQKAPVKTASQKKDPEKNYSINNVDRVQKNWTPPPGSSPVEEATAQKKAAETESRLSLQKEKTSLALRNFGDSLSEYLLKFRASANKNKAPFIAGGVLIAFLVVIVISKLSCSSTEKAPATSGYLPPNIQVMNEHIIDNSTETRIETYVVASDSVQKDEISKLLTKVYEFQRSRTGFSSKKPPSSVSVYAYSSANIYKTDSEWWLGRLLWVEGSEPQININTDALLPRQEEIGYGALTLDEYLNQVDEVSDSLKNIMSQMRSNFRDYEKLTLSESAFKEQSESLSDELYELTQNLPEPPVNDCAELNSAFHSLVESTIYFQDLFAPDSGVFESKRLDTEEYYAKLNAFTAAHGAYAAERTKFE